MVNMSGCQVGILINFLHLLVSLSGVNIPVGIAVARQRQENNPSKKGKVPVIETCLSACKLAGLWSVECWELLRQEIGCHDVIRQSLVSSDIVLSSQHCCWPFPRHICSIDWLVSVHRDSFPDSSVLLPQIQPTIQTNIKLLGVFTSPDMILPLF